MRIAITGATGIVGRFVVARLLSERAQVQALARPESDRRGLDACRWITGDMANHSALADLVRNADALVHCAYGHVPGRYRGGEGDDRFAFWQNNLLAGVALLEHARQAGVARVVVLSSRAVFGAQTPAAYSVDDATRPVPDSHYGALKLALEAHASAFSTADGMCCAALRPTGVYGVVQPVERSKWFDLAMAMRRQEPLPAARLATEVHGRDVADAVWRLLNAPAEHVAGRAFNCSDLIVDGRDVMAGLAERLGIEPNLPATPENSLLHPMRTPALRALGWRPGGRPLLERTLDELATLAKSQRL